MKAYAGKVLKIDLSTQKTSLYPWTDSDRERFLGGKVMAAKIIYDLLDDKIKPLSEENIVVISTGPMTGTGAPASSRFNVSSISPLTGLITSSNCGGDFGLMLKKTGYDALIISGKASDKVWLELTEDSISFHDAKSLWGMHVDQVQEALPKRYGKLVIGPAGENQVKYAGLFSGERTAGRGGIGAVFGYKNLKAIATFGKIKTQVYDSTIKSFYKNWISKLRMHPLTGKQLPTFGTAGLLTIMHHNNILATRNFNAGRYNDFDKVSGESLKENHVIKKKGCITCPIQCGRQVKVHDKIVKGPELETIGLFGPNILNNNLEAICRWNLELDEYGMDSISTAGVIAFAMELNEKGLWDNGLEFGKIDNLSEIIRMIAYREGIGNDLAEGVKFLSDKYGGHDFAIHSKGMELSAYEPRGAVGQGLGYAVSNRGGCHLNAGYIVLFEGLSMNMNPYKTTNKAEFTIFSQDMMEACSAAGQCVFTLQMMLPKDILEKPNSGLTSVANKLLTTPITAFIIKRLNYMKSLPIHLPMIPHSKGIKLATGMKMDLGRFKTIGERGFNLERMINLKRGLKASDDGLPKRLTHEAQAGVSDAKVPLESLKKQFYACRGWDQEGIPKEKTLRKLGLYDDQCLFLWKSEKLDADITDEVTSKLS
ncbi:aldehyde:ferredoxin oxidoreductase [Acidaminobacter sp. JC074]|uniref:aldehyde ferredoxin oxidoreductase family protein n=1 Tax=Acidaminobacter sp. JC074 TaxID=2530199 RepID=UPI001F0FE13E|nr:aldehyde ferredoxin oxidoreductase family protein [Acidaminobacter sp. JC074]MCH4888156.1 aldehyde:ferredoxin oxidoreductase [Acidaminobacter sp. JC074]